MNTIFVITLPVREAGRYATARYLLSLVLFAVASVVAAGIVGIVLGTAGSLAANHAPWFLTLVAALIGGIALVYGLAEHAGVAWWIPERQWLVPYRWSWYGPFRFATAFGALLGAGFFTKIPFIGYHLLLALCVLIADPVRGGVLMACFGVARVLPVIAVPLVMRLRRRVYTPGIAVAAVAWYVEANRVITGFRATVLFAVTGGTLAIVLVQSLR